MTAMAQALSGALVAFVWQGLLAAFLLWTALFLLRSYSPRVRYLASCAALSVMAALPAVTAFLLYRGPAAPHTHAGWFGAAPGAIRDATLGLSGSGFDWTAWLSRWALPAWCAGVLLCSLRLVWASRQISVLRRQSKAAEDSVLAMAAGIQRRMGLTRPVRVLMTARAADGPLVAGWIKPVVMLPAATILGLTTQQLEAILAHELAHILRYDYLVNMLQSMVETLLFYHPAVWWASARMRHERELCCDDVAVACCGDAACYARALTHLEKMRAAAPALAMGSTGGSLLYRIQRLAGEAGRPHGPSKLSGIMALSLGLICLAINIQWARGQQQAAPVGAAAADTSGVADDAGVRVDLKGASVMHREPVEYPEPALHKGIQGTVVVDATLDESGAVSDARVLSGPAELRKAALESVLQWHFTRDERGGARQIGIEFQVPAGEGISGGVRGGVTGGVSGDIRGGVHGGIRGGVQPEISSDELQRQSLALAETMKAKQLAELEARLSGLGRTYQKDHPDVRAAEAKLDALLKQMGELNVDAETLQNKLQEADALMLSRRAQMMALEKRLAESQDALDMRGGVMFAGRRLKTIEIHGLGAAAHDELLGKLPAHLGEVLAEDSMEKIDSAVKQFDEHLNVSMRIASDGQVELRIAAPSGDGLVEPPQ